MDPEEKARRAPSERIGRLLTWPGPLVAAVAVLLLAVALFAVTNADDRPRADVGQVFEHPFQEDPLDDVGEVFLPWARLEVGDGQPREDLPDLLGEPANVQAPDGGSFVRVRAAIDTDHPVPLTAIDSPYAEETTLVLRADGKDYPLSGPGGLVFDPNGSVGQGGERWVAVDGHPTDLEVLVTVDGLTQVVDASDGSVDAGRAAELADLPSPDALHDLKPVGCGSARRLDDTALRITYPDPFTCTVKLVMRTPYADGLGWAEDGREFVVVHIVPPYQPSLETGQGDDIESWDSETRFVPRLAGGRRAGPEARVNELSQSMFTLQDPDDPVQFVYDVPQGEPLGDLTVRFTARATLDAPFVTDRARVRAEWTIAGEDLE